MSGLSVGELKLLPGSDEAIKAGCICQLSPKNDKYLINEHCQIHWYILMVSRTMEMHRYIIKRDSELTVLLIGLIIAVLVTFGVFVFKF